MNWARLLPVAGVFALSACVAPGNDDAAVKNNLAKADCPAEGESISEAGWFARETLPPGHVFPEVLRGRFWDELASGFPAPIKLPLRQSIF